MAHFAVIDKQTNIINQVITVDNSKITINQITETESISKSPFSSSGVIVTKIEVEQMGVDFLVPFFDNTVYFKQTSYSGSFRKNFAGKGFIWRQDLDGFVPPKPKYSKILVDPNNYSNLIEDTGEWLLDEKTCKWNWYSSKSVDLFLRRLFIPSSVKKDSIYILNNINSLGNTKKPWYIRFKLYIIEKLNKFINK